MQEVTVPDLKDSHLRLLEILSDRKCVSILGAINKEPKPVSQISCECSICPGVVYRKLTLLKAAGMVDSNYKIRPDGKKFFLYRSLLDHINFSFNGDKVLVDVDLRARPGPGMDTK